MDKINKLKALLELSQNDTITPKEVEKFLTLLIGVVKKSKQDFDKLSSENLKTIKDSIAYIEQYHKENLALFKKEKNLIITEFLTTSKELKDLIAKVKTIKPIDGKDGKDGKNPDPKEVAELVLKALPETKEITGEDIANKLEMLDGEDRLDAKAIKNLPKFVQNQVGGVVARNIYQMGDVVLTSLANNDTLKWNGTNNRWENGAGGGAGTIDGSGTANELSYWVDADTLGTLAVATYPSLTELSYVKGVTSSIQTQLNGKQASGSYLTASNIVETITNGVTTNAPSENAVFDALALKEPLKGADDNYVTDAQLIVIGNTSGTNTGDQDLSSLAPKTSPTFATSITGSYLTASEMLITDGSKNIVSAAVATYPSLTELTYLKGVTSAIQTQLNAKQASDTQLTDLAGLSYAGNASKYVRVKATEDGFELATVAAGTIDGSGTTNELTYWVDSDTLGTLAVATYPSLTELSYVKGVTSAIQTQINGKQPLDTQLTAIAALADAAGVLTNDGAGNMSWAAVSGLSWGSSISGTTANGLALTLSNTADASASAFKITAGNTQSNQTALANIQMGTSTRSMGLLIQGTGSTSTGGLGSGRNHLTLWGDTNSNVNTVLSVGNGTSYTENLSILANGALTITNATNDRAITINSPASMEDGKESMKITMSNTNTNQPVALSLQIGTSGNALGLLIQGTGSSTGGAAGTGKNHVTLWGNTANNVNKVLSYGNGTSYTENGYFLAHGGYISTSSTGDRQMLSLTETAIGDSDVNIAEILYTPANDSQSNTFDSILKVSQTAGRSMEMGLNVAMVNSSGSLVARTTASHNALETTLSRTLTAGLTITDTSARAGRFLRTSVSNHASANYTISSPTLEIEQVATQTLGTLAVSGAVLKLAASNVASFTGNFLENSLGGTTNFAITKAGAIELGHASDTTLARASAGVVSVEGKTLVNLTDGGTFAADISVPDEAYGVGWNGSNEVPTKNAVYDKIETIGGMPKVTYITCNQGNGPYTFSTDDIDVEVGVSTTADFITVSYLGAAIQLNLITAIWADADAAYSAVVLGQYVYVLLADEGATPDAWRVYRADYTNLAGGWTQMTFSGVTLTAANTIPAMTCDGTNFYFAYDANNSANAYALRKCSISGTTFTSVSTITCGAADTGFGTQNYAVLASGNIFAHDTTNNRLTKYNSSGTQQYQETTDSLMPQFTMIVVIENTIYGMIQSAEAGESSGLCAKLNYSDA